MPLAEDVVSRIQMMERRVQIDRVHHERVGSTNDIAKTLASEGLRRPLLISAEEQTRGRGRMGRAWSSPQGGAWMTLVWPGVPDDDRDVLSTAPLVVGLAVADTIDAMLRNANDRHDSQHVQIKWPNDVLLGGKKVAGVLCEREVGPSGGSPLIVGVGVNVANDTSSLGSADGPPRFPPISISEFAGVVVRPADVVDAFVDRVVPLLERLVHSGFTPELRRAIEDRMAYIKDGIVRIGRSEPAEVLGVDDAGRLRVRFADQSEARYASGEVRIESGR